MDTGFPDWGWPIAVLVVALGAGLALRLVAYRLLPRLVRRTAFTLDDVVLESVQPLVLPWCALAGVALALHSELVPPFLAEAGPRVVKVGLTLTLAFGMAAFASRLVAQRAELPGHSMAAATLTRQFVRVAVLAIGVLLVLGNLGIEIGPLLTALGVGSLAVALALQPTLTNMFAGFNLTASRGIRVGDFVELEGGRRGHVVDIGWRNTRIRELDDFMVVVPNSRIAEMVTVNYSMPGAELVIRIDIGVAPGSDLDHVERVLLDVANELQRSSPHAIAEGRPRVNFREFGSSTIDLTLLLRAKSYPDQGRLRSDAIKAVKARLEAEGIELPYPHLVLLGEVRTTGRNAATAAAAPEQDAPERQLRG